MSRCTIALRTRTLALAALAAAAAAPVAAQERPAPFGSVVEVSRLLLEVRVVDSNGEPVPELTAADFEVTIGGRTLEVESALWVPASASAVSALPGAGGEHPAQREPRLVVVVFQTDINHYRIRGTVRMAPQAARFVRGLERGDLVALFTFESHLELRSDFTADHEAVARMLTTGEILEGRAAAPQPAETSLAGLLNNVDARRAATLTRALEVVGRSLIPIPGPKALVLFGCGLGRYNAGHAIIERGSYGPALGALTAARAAVFALDITTADFHTLELGLRTVSRDTGGLYIKTHLFPDSAVDKLARVISGHYELAVMPPPEDVGGDRELEITVHRRGAETYFRRSLSPRWKPSVEGTPPPGR